MEVFNSVADGCPRYLRPDDLGPKELPVLKEEEEDEDEEEEMETLVIKAPEEKWDCETIISESGLSERLQIKLKLLQL